MKLIRREDIISKLKDSGMVPVFNHPDLEVCKSVVKACYDGGLRVFEFTNRSEAAWEVFTELKKYINNEMPDMLIGVGSILNSFSTTRFLLSGADFIVSPALVDEMANVCDQEDILWIPGCGTVTEIVRAQNLGAEVVKIFPGAQVGGPAFVKAVLGPMPWSSIMPTGGVSPDKENLKAWFDAGVCCVGMGSNLFPKEWIKNGEYSKITALVKETLVTIKEIRAAK
jgi:2-dehydro-3-deoxyphosphogluconate aldolase/(4S)-4-hydroxy-2-oxoglutarate aldolase